MVHLSGVFLDSFRNRHSVVIGRTRSGKTVFTGKVLEGLQAKNTHTIFVDPKHDKDFAHLGTICQTPIEVYEQLLLKNEAIVFRPSATDEKREELDRMVELLFVLQRTAGFKRIKRVIAIDEIQLFAKKGGSKAIEMIWTIGAGLGIVGMALTQRIQLLNETAWSQSENKVIFCIDDRPEYLRSRNLQHYVDLHDFYNDSINKYWFYYTLGDGQWKKHKPVSLGNSKNKKRLTLSRW